MKKLSLQLKVLTAAMIAVGLVVVGVLLIKPFDKQVAPAYAFSLPTKYSQTVEVKRLSDIISIKALNAQAASQLVSQNKNSSIYTYPNVYEYTDVKYTVAENMLKEDIILKQVGHPLEFQWDLGDISQYKSMKNKGSLEFYKNTQMGKEKVFTIPAPFMIDAKGEKSFEIEVKLDGSILTIVPDKEWLAAAAYPVLLDPTIEINVINIHSHPQKGDDWIVEFTTIGGADLTITPADQATVVDDEFSGLYCGDEQRQPQILPGDVIFYPDWQCGETAKVVHYTKIQGNHHLIFDFGGQQAEAYNSTWLSGYDYRKEITITGQTGAGTNYQVPFSIGSASGGDFHLEGNAANFPNDLRFTDNDAETELDYWIEDTAADPIVVWVEVADSLETNTTIYTYYGKSGDSSASNIKDTFVQAVDFGTDTVSSYGGSQDIGSGSEWTVSGSENYIRFGLDSYRANNWKYIDVGSLNITSGDYMIELDYKSDSNEVEISGVGHDTVAGAGSIETGKTYTFDGTQSWGLNGANVTQYNRGTGGWQPIQAVLNDYTGAHDAITIAHDYDSGSVSDDYFRNIRVRKYMSTEPDFSSASSEESNASGGEGADYTLKVQNGMYRFQGGATIRAQ